PPYHATLYLHPGDPPLFGELLDSAHLRGLSSLTLDYRERPTLNKAEEFRQLLRSPLMEGLVKLTVQYGLIDTREMKAIVNSPKIKNLKILEFYDCGFEDAALYALANSPHLGQLEALSLREGEFDFHNAEVLADIQRGSLHLKVRADM